MSIISYIFQNEINSYLNVNVVIVHISIRCSIDTSRMARLVKSSQIVRLLVLTTPPPAGWEKKQTHITMSQVMGALMGQKGGKSQSERNLLLLSPRHRSVYTPNSAGEVI